MEIFAAEVGNVMGVSKENMLDRGSSKPFAVGLPSQPTARPTQMRSRRQKGNCKLACGERKSADHHGGHCETERKKK